MEPPPELYSRSHQQKRNSNYNNDWNNAAPQQDSWDAPPQMDFGYQPVRARVALMYVAGGFQSQPAYASFPPSQPQAQPSYNAPYNPYKKTGFDDFPPADGYAQRKDNSSL
jgi:hypothetical protein